MELRIPKLRRGSDFPGFPEPPPMAEKDLRCHLAKMSGSFQAQCPGLWWRRIVSAWIGTAFAQDDADATRKQWREVADQARPRVPKLAELMDEAEADVLANMQFPAQHRQDPQHEILWN